MGDDLDLNEASVDSLNFFFKIPINPQNHKIFKLGVNFIHLIM